MNKSIKTSIESIKKQTKVKFDETLDIAIKFNLKKGMSIKGNIEMPSGLGKKVSVAVFTHQPKEALSAGAEYAGAEDLVEKITKKQINLKMVDVFLATPDAIMHAAKVSRVLGPRGLMPNAKQDTVTSNIAAKIQSLQKGYVSYKTDQTGIIHAGLGKLSFSAEQLRANVSAFMQSVSENADLNTLMQIYLTSTMGTGSMLLEKNLVLNEAGIK